MDAATLLRTTLLADDALAKRAPYDRDAYLLDLVTRLVDGDLAACTPLYDATIGLVRGIVLRVVRDEVDADDIVADAYETALRDAKRYDARRGPVVVWLSVIARSRALDYVRKNRSASRTPLHVIDTLADPTSRNDLAWFTDRLQMYAALSRISLLRRGLIISAFLDGLSHAEIASRTGLAIGTVKSHIRRGLADLRALLD